MELRGRNMQQSQGTQNHLKRQEGKDVPNKRWGLHHILKGSLAP